jgi:hypothetical protein
MRRAAFPAQPFHVVFTQTIARTTQGSVPVESMAELPAHRMKKTTLLLLLLTAWFVGGVSPLGAQGQPSSSSQARALSKAEKRRQKATKKYAKAQKKAERKMLKTERKNTRYPSHPSL